MKKNIEIKLKENLENLILLVETNDKTKVESFINNFSSGVNDNKISLAFLYSCKIGRIEIAKSLLDCVNPNSRYGDGQTALMLFSQIDNNIKDKADFLELLLERGCDFDLVDCCGKSALHWAVIKNCSWSTRILINRCNVNSIDLIGMTPLMYAAKCNLCSVISLLLHAGADPTKSSKQQGSAIHLAIRHRSSAALQQMSPFCRHWNILDARNQTPLDLAILLDNFEMVKILIESKKEIELNRRPSFAPFRTPLEEACFKNNSEIIKILISAGADVNHSLEFDFELERSCRSKPVAPLMLAISKQNVEIIQLLIDKGADVGIRCPKAPGHVLLTTPLAMAAELGNEEIMKLLTRTDREFESADFGEAFNAACSSQNVDIVKSLLKEHNISPSQYRLKNGLPIMLELVKHFHVKNDMEKILLFDKDIITDIFTPQVAQLLSRKSFGSSMQLYREAWIKALLQFHSGPIDIPASSEVSYLNFIISFLEYFFLKKRMDDLELIQEKLREILIFPPSLIRLAIHSSRLIKAILLSRSTYALIFFTEMHLDENLIFWDQKSEQILDCSEFSLFFDNIDAALILNLTCGTSLNFIIDYDRFPYTPDIVNPSIDYNDVDKISALKYLSKNVKPLRTLCKYAIRKSINDDSLITKLTGLSQLVLDDLFLDLSRYISYFEMSQNSLVRYYHLGRWAGVDLQAFNFTDF